jgi:hypothetical protein
MTEKRKQKINEEAKRRLNLWLTHSSFDDMTVGGSKIRFDMALGLNGYPFEKEQWMKGNGFTRFITDKEFDSDEYDNIINALYASCNSALSPPSKTNLSPFSSNR